MLAFLVRVMSAQALLLTATFFGAPAANASDEPRVVATVPVGATPYGIAVSPDGSKVYVSNSTGGSVSIIETATRQVSLITSNVGPTPTGIVFNSSGSIAYVANFKPVTDFSAGTITSINVATGATTLLTTSIDCREILNLAITSDDSNLYLTCQGDGRIVQYQLGSPAIQTTLFAQNLSAPTDIAISADDSKIIATLSGLDDAYIREGVSQGDIGVTTGPFSVAISSVSGLAYVAGQTSGNISVVDLETRSLVGDEITVGGFLTDIAITPDGRTAIVSSLNDSKVKFVDLATNSVTSLSVGDGPQSIAVSSDGRFLYTANRNSNDVTVVALPQPPASGEYVPRAPIQQFAIDPSDPCEGVPDQFTDFPGIDATLRTAAWGKSWAMWPHGGTGGFVCTRQPYYTTADTWAVM
jgi:YVTN family beta-propeller protein